MDLLQLQTLPKNPTVFAPGGAWDAVTQVTPHAHARMVCILRTFPASGGPAHLSAGVLLPCRIT